MEMATPTPSTAAVDITGGDDEPCERVQGGHVAAGSPAAVPDQADAAQKRARETDALPLVDQLDEDGAADPKRARVDAPPAAEQSASFEDLNRRQGRAQAAR